VELSVGMGTDVGRMRSSNEDSLFADANAHRGLFIVADGMGGHAAGEVASSMAVDIISTEMPLSRGIEDGNVQEALTEALRHANDAIYRRTVEEVEKQGMGTTVSALFLAGSRYVIGHVGDSRIYLMRDGDFMQLTKDHSYVQEQVDAGLLTPEQARSHPYSNVITRCCGATSDVEPDVQEGDFREGDVFLLASDGLTAMLDDKRIEQILRTPLSPSRVVAKLIAEANARGGVDNITAILVHVTGPSSPAIRTVPGTTGEHGQR
jgi:PPM family protein phosphatase